MAWTLSQLKARQAGQPDFFGGQPATKALRLDAPAPAPAAPAAVVKSILSAPVRRWANEEAETALHEAAHAVVAQALGYQVKWMSAVSGQVYLDPRPWRPTKLDAAAIALAGLASDTSNDPAVAERCLSSWSELERRMSASDFKMLLEAVDCPGSEQALKQDVSDAFLLARSTLAVYRQQLDRLRNALARKAALEAHEVRALWNL